MKKTLIALALVALILASVTFLAAPHVKADTTEAKILSFSWYVAPSNTYLAEYSGDLIVVGAVQDVGTNPLSSVFVAGAAYNSTGSLLASAETATFATYMNPGDIAPFYLDFTPENSVSQDQSWEPLVSNVTVSVVYVNDTQTMNSGLVIPAGSVAGALDNTGTYTLTGTVQNTGNQATGNVWVVSTFYNSSGTVVGLNYTNYISSSISPGGVAAFFATPTDNSVQLSNSITNYTELIQSSPLTTSTTPTPTAPTTQPTSPTSSGSPTQPPSSTAIPKLAIYAAVAVIIVLAILAVLLLLRRRRNALFDLPPPPPPS